MIKDNTLTIVIPIKNPPCIDKFISENLHYLNKYGVVIIDSGGGEKLREFATVYLNQELCLTDARKLGITLVKTPFLLNLDCDVKIPEGYIELALELLKDNVGAVSIFYNNINHCQGALEFGISLWQTDILKKLYDFSFTCVCNGNIIKIGEGVYSRLQAGWCECNYMWRKLKDDGYKLETLNLRAIHLREMD